MKHTDQMISEIKKRKEYLNNQSIYNENPKISAILLSFNHDYRIEALYERLKGSSFEEIIICEDGSIDRSMDLWLSHLHNKNHYILRSNDIHELRAYQKAIQMSEAEFVCLLQDDDILPEDNDWITTAEFLFQKYPKLAVLGGARGRDISFKATWGYGTQKNTFPIPFKEPEIGKKFIFVENLNIGPYFIRKNVFLELGGWNKQCSNAGEPGILFESEFCYRAWQAGYEVALTDMGKIKTADDDRGTMIFNKGNIRQVNLRKNIKLMQQNYNNFSKNILKNKVTKLNKSLIKIDKEF